MEPVIQGEETESILETLQLAGRLIMENGGETYRVEETVCRMGHAFGLENVESFAVPSGLFISCKTRMGEVKTGIQRVYRGGTNLERVDEVNRISRRVEHEGMTWQEAQKELAAIQRMKQRSWLFHMIASGICAAGFAVMFGGRLVDAFVACAVSFLVEGMSGVLGRFHMRSFAAVLAGSFVSTLIPMTLQYFTGVLLTDAVIAGALMPLLPGLSMTNAVQDTMRGDIVSGVSHFSQAVLTASLIAVGALCGTYLIRMVTGGV